MIHPFRLSATGTSSRRSRRSGSAAGNSTGSSPRPQKRKDPPRPSPFPRVDPDIHLVLGPSRPARQRPGAFYQTNRIPGAFHAINHHLAHAASAFYPSPFEEAAVLTVDGVGEWETVWMGRGRGRDLERRCSQGWPHSLGTVYTAVTQFLGFQIFSDEYKVMGLAPYGELARLDRFREIITLRTRGSGSIPPTSVTTSAGRTSSPSGSFKPSAPPPPGSPTAPSRNDTKTWPLPFRPGQRKS